MHESSYERMREFALKYLKLAFLSSLIKFSLVNRSQYFFVANGLIFSFFANCLKYTSS